LKKLGFKNRKNKIVWGLCHYKAIWNS